MNDGGGERDSSPLAASAVVDPPPQRLAVARSPYRRRLDGAASPGQSIVSLSIHVVAWLVAASWLVVELSRETSDRAVPLTLLMGSVFLVVAPSLVTRWEQRLQRFEDVLRTDRSLGDESWRRMSENLARLASVRHAIVAAPVVLISVAYLAGDSFFADRLNLPEGGIAFIVGLLVLQLGGLAAGWGVHGAAATIAVALASARQHADFAPYAGTPSRASHALGSFCFSTAVMYGAAGALLVPGLCAATWVADGMTKVALAGAVVMVLAITVALLAVPAVVLSRRSEDDRAAYLDRLSAQIDELGRAASDPSVPFDEAQYVRLRALLEMRTHVVTHAVGNSSVEMVKRIPVAVLLPTASVAASWLSLVAT